MQFIRTTLVFLVFAAAAASAAESGLRVGAARVDQTGPLGPSQSGKYDHEHVYARAIVLDNGATRAAIIGYEGAGNGSLQATRQGVAALLNCPVENVLISHTHTHSSQSGPSAMFGERQTPTGPVKEILDAVTQAKAKLQPARMSFGTGAAYLNVNRDAIDPVTRKWEQGSNLNGPADRTVAVLSFLKPSGEPIAVYVNYAMHPINGYVVGVLTADFPGAMSRYVEKAFGDNVVVAFTQGTSGDLNPLYLRPSTNAMASRDGMKITGFEMEREAAEGPLRMAYTEQAKGGAPAKPADPKVVDDLFRFIESQGQVLGEEVIRVMTFAGKPADNVRIAGAQKVLTCPARKRIVGNSLDPSTREGVEAKYEDAPPSEVRVGILSLGTVALAWINGEVFNAIGSRIKNESPMKNTFVVTLANERVNGYIPDDASYGHQTFQVLGSRFKQGCAETSITNAVVEMEAQYLNGR